jgi:hypothetical protein
VQLAQFFGVQVMTSDLKDSVSSCWSEAGQAQMLIHSFAQAEEEWTFVCLLVVSQEAQCLIGDLLQSQMVDAPIQVSPSGPESPRRQFVVYDIGHQQVVSDPSYQLSLVEAFGPIVESQVLGLERSLGIPTAEISTHLHGGHLHVGELPVDRSRRDQLG